MNFFLEGAGGGGGAELINLKTLQLKKNHFKLQNLMFYLEMNVRSNGFFLV